MGETDKVIEETPLVSETGVSEDVLEEELREPAEQSQLDSGSATTYRAEDIYADEVSCENKVSVNFSNLNAKLDDEEVVRTRQLINEMAEGRSVSRLHVVGHTDSVPISPRARHKFANNLVLSQYRARAFGALLRQIYPEAVTTTEGRGAREPVASNATKLGRQQNRRAETCIEFDEDRSSVAEESFEEIDAQRNLASNDYLGVQVNLECDCAYNPWVTEVTAGGVLIQDSDHPDLESEGGLGFSILQRYIFNEELRLKQIENMVLGKPADFNVFDHHRGSFGLFLGVDFYDRNISFSNGEEDRAASVDFPFGISYQFSLTDQIIQIFDVGLYYSVPLGNYNLLPSTFAETPQESYGVYLAWSAFYSLNLHMSLGLKLSYKHALENHFESLQTSSVADSAFSDLAVGISLRYDY